MSHPLHRQFNPDVPEPLLESANSIESHLLKEASVTRQLIMAVREVLLAVEEQTTKTNGRVNAHDTLHIQIRKDVDDLHKEKEITGAKTALSKAWVLVLWAVAVSIVFPVVLVVLNTLARHYFP